MLEQELIDAYSLKVDFFTELTQTKINFMEVTNLGDKIIKIEDTISKTFKKLMSISMNNSKLVYLYIDYKKNLCHETKAELMEYYERLSYLVRKERESLMIYDGLKFNNINQNKSPNLYSKNNMLIFVNVNKSVFNISKWTSNTCKFFGYSDSELKGMNIN